MLVLLGGLNGTVVAQETESPSFDVPYEVTGQVFFPRVTRSREVTWDEERRVEERQLYRQGRIVHDDPRLSGWMLWTSNVETWGGPWHSGLGEVMAGSAQLVNDDGSWVGTFRGWVAERPRRRHMLFELTGTGAYEGHSALLWGQGRTVEMHIDVQGFVFPGWLPEYPPEPKVITDPVEVVGAKQDAVAGYKDDLPKKKAIELAVKSIASAIERDAATGNNILCSVIDKSGYQEIDKETIHKIWKGQ